MDYRKFLGREEEQVLPYLGGASVHALDRRLRLAQPPGAPGWYRFGVKGRDASVKGPAEPPPLSALPVVRGHVLGGRLVREGAVAEPLELLPEESPPRFAPCRARRWPSGDLLFEELEFEGDAEEAARRALEEGGSLGEVRGCPATLRAAFGYALVEEVARRRGVPVSPAEARARVGAVADRGAAEVDALLRRLVEERERAERELREARARRETERVAHGAARLAQAAQAERERRMEVARRSFASTEEEASLRAEAACEAAGARLRSSRLLGGGQLEVVFSFQGERFISVVEAATLRVLDAGICLDGADARVTLDSLFSVIKEALETGQLVMTRHA